MHTKELTNVELYHAIMPCVISADSDPQEAREILDAAQEAASELYHRAEAVKGLVEEAAEMARALIRAKDHLIMSEGHFVIDGKVGQSGDWKEVLEQTRAALSSWEKAGKGNDGLSDTFDLHL